MNHDLVPETIVRLEISAELANIGTRPGSRISMQHWINESTVELKFSKSQNFQLILIITITRNGFAT